MARVAKTVTPPRDSALPSCVDGTRGSEVHVLGSSAWGRRELRLTLYLTLMLRSTELHLELDGGESRTLLDGGLQPLTLAATRLGKSNRYPCGPGASSRRLHVDRLTPGRWTPIQVLGPLHRRWRGRRDSPPNLLMTVNRCGARQNTESETLRFEGETATNTAQAALPTPEPDFSSS
jgi:hypothetical protein